MKQNRIVNNAIFVLIITAGLAFSAGVKDGWRVIDESNRLPVVKEKIVIGRVWSSHRVGFFLMTEGDKQYVAYYNAERRMIAGMRRLSEKKFKLAMIRSKLNRPARTGEDASSTILGCRNRGQSPI